MNLEATAKAVGRPFDKHKINRIVIFRGHPNDNIAMLSRKKRQQEFRMHMESLFMGDTKNGFNLERKKLDDERERQFSPRVSVCFYIQNKTINVSIAVSKKIHLHLNACNCSKNHFDCFETRTNGLKHSACRSYRSQNDRGIFYLWADLDFIGGALNSDNVSPSQSRLSLFV